MSRFCQFKLRTLLSILLLICVILGGWVVPAIRREEAVRAIESRQGQVWFDHQLSADADSRLTHDRESRFMWLGTLRPHTILLPYRSDLEPVFELHEVRRIYVGLRDFGDSYGDSLSRMHSWRRMGLRREWFHPSFPPSAPAIDLRRLGRLTDLETLELDGFPVSDLTPLRSLRKLQTLSLDFTRVTDLGPLAGLTQLRQLSLKGTRVADLTPLHGMSHLESLSLEDTPVTDLTSLSRLSRLKWLALDGSTRRVNGPIDLTPLSQLIHLEGVDVTGLPIVDLAPIARLKNLLHLSLGATGASDLRALADLPELRSLELQGNPVTDLAPLENLRHLEHLDLRDTPITEDQVHAFQLRHPDCRVSSGESYRG